MIVEDLDLWLENLLQMISRQVTRALQLIDAMCNTVLEGSVSMPRSIFSVCQCVRQDILPWTSCLIRCYAEN